MLTIVVLAGHLVMVAKFGVSEGFHALYVRVRDLYLECPLPSISSLLENSRIKDTDSFVICVQIHSPIGPFFPQQPSTYYVPKELLDGLEGSLDNASQWISVFFTVG